VFNLTEYHNYLFTFYFRQLTQETCQVNTKSSFLLYFYMLSSVV